MALNRGAHTAPERIQLTVAAEVAKESVWRRFPPLVLVLHPPSTGLYNSSTRCSRYGTYTNFPAVGTNFHMAPMTFSGPSYVTPMVSDHVDFLKTSSPPTTV